jgi:predicted lactoylglutathione lyase
MCGKFNYMQKKSVYINLIVKDLAKATAFYEAIGCTKNALFSNEVASSMMWSEEIIFMLLTEEFARNFSDGKSIPNQKESVSAFYSLSLASKEEVDEFCAKAKSAGGRVYENKFNQEMAGDFMYSFEVEDTEGYILEPAFMDISKFPQE